MNKYYKNILFIIFITALLLFVFNHWLGINLFGQITILLVGIYAIYLNLHARLVERNDS
ncbi:hypothetical protein [Oceanobacillus manasiensis]|uniref:hypothetical protein n=1 Tax=Oceanobacillus manasiensis TaxID=586413 RepID=UPI0012EB8C93|nr:hypothetical protein [Oceanobacillus manasiensis]